MNAFALGFTVGAVIGLGVGWAFRVHTAGLAAGKASLSGAAVREEGAIAKALAAEERAAGMSPRLAPGIRPEARAIGHGHAFDKHVLKEGQFTDLGVTTRGQFSEHISRVIDAAGGTNVRSLTGGRMAYWDDITGTVVIKNPQAPDLGTAFRPKTGRSYFEGLM